MLFTYIYIVIIIMCLIYIYLLYLLYRKISNNIINYPMNDTILRQLDKLLISNHSKVQELYDSGDCGGDCVVVV